VLEAASHGGSHGTERSFGGQSHVHHSVPLVFKVYLPISYLEFAAMGLSVQLYVKQPIKGLSLGIS